MSKLDPVELKNVYRKQILLERTDVNSAGLGIIDMAIKSGGNMTYNFLPLNAEVSFYLLQVEITINK